MTGYWLLPRLCQWMGNGKEKGFTLVELLVTTIIIGILAAIGMQNYIYQVGRARETEAKNNLGAIARGQQAYHWEHGEFADDVSKLGISIPEKYYQINTTWQNDYVKHQAQAVNPEKDQVRNYAIGVYHNSGSYAISLCQSLDVNGSVNVGDTPDADCVGPNTIKIK
ncbi:MAG: type IV pilin-like G/H family protein [Geminocystis sp.]|nr:type IV pilin-like G/H family protein [Geminocystis sp.]HIK37097.1 type IV pilin-like G/H family protein [Geminocystis sp. M7585_C2015_104]MCS7148621.1 type IV pilin-like G/H family protein [Geminocystis sp.]MCX8079395.1 type IV pilin-like G/H family protein [Geminocystis sp.]MDW8114987.1 type IV pilin-like G/H family protein [Geminocystis sp.]